MTKPTKGSRRKSLQTRQRVVKHDGKTYSLAVITKGRDVSPEEKLKIAAVVCELYSSDEYTLEDCLKHCGVRSFATWHKWTVEIEAIDLLYSEAQKSKDWKYRHKLKQRGRTMAEKLIEGFVVELTDREGEALTDEEGNVVEGFKVLRIKKKQLYVKPSPKIIETVLFNMDKGNFKSNPDPLKPDDERPPNDIKIEIIGTRISPITREEDVDRSI